MKVGLLGGNKMENLWTFSINGIDWPYDTYSSAQEALVQGIEKISYNQMEFTIWMGRLSTQDDQQLEFIVTDIEKMNFFTSTHEKTPCAV